MNDPLKNQADSQADMPANHAQQQPAAGDGTPKFGKLLIVLVLTVILIGFITFASERFYS
ncbi:hypothetical protein [Paraherbaspirillum soli]|uniref:Uncharacterized protein n=1 Tax=Paraherbaspirillum soli TaxID=631222 RepID=A0ABW0MDE2_9BURK